MGTVREGVVWTSACRHKRSTVKAAGRRLNGHAWWCYECVDWVPFRRETTEERQIRRIGEAS